MLISVEFYESIRKPQVVILKTVRLISTDADNNIHGNRAMFQNICCQYIIIKVERVWSGQVSLLNDIFNLVKRNAVKRCRAEPYCLNKKFTNTPVSYLLIVFTFVWKAWFVSINYPNGFKDLWQLSYNLIDGLKE